jgi:hypothetical protein
MMRIWVLVQSPISSVFASLMSLKLGRLALPGRSLYSYLFSLLDGNTDASLLLLLAVICRCCLAAHCPWTRRGHGANDIRSTPCFFSFEAATLGTTIQKYVLKRATGLYDESIDFMQGIFTFPIPMVIAWLFVLFLNIFEGLDGG